MSQRLNSFFTCSPQLRELTHRAQQLAALQRLYQNAITPTLAGASRVIGFEQRIVTVGADNSAIAAKLRQLGPHILPQLQGDDTEVTGILVKVQVSQPAPVHTHATHALGEAARQRIADLAATMGDSPLRRALQRLIRR